MKHQEDCRMNLCMNESVEHRCGYTCTCTPIESPEEKSECKGTCEVEGGNLDDEEEIRLTIKEKIEEVERDFTHSSLCKEGMKGCNCGVVELLYDFASEIQELQKSFLRSELTKARQEERTQLLKEVGEKVDGLKLDTSPAEGYNNPDADIFNAALSAVKEILSANK